MNWVSTTENEKWSKNNAYKHFSHFVKRDAVMLKTKGAFSSNATVFENPDGSRVAVIVNPFSVEKVLTINQKNYILKPRSFHTIVLD